MSSGKGDEWIFYPSVDYAGNDVIHIGQKSIEELKKYASDNKEVVCFNTDGWMKRLWNPGNMNKWKWSPSGTTGLYVRKEKEESKDKKKNEDFVPSIIHQTKLDKDNKKVCEEIGWEYIVWEGKEFEDFWNNKYKIINEYGGIFVESDRKITKEIANIDRSNIILGYADNSPLIDEGFIGFNEDSTMGRLMIEGKEKSFMKMLTYYYDLTGKPTTILPASSLSKFFNKFITPDDIGPLTYSY